MNLILTISAATIALCMVIIIFAALGTLLRLRRVLEEVQKFVETARLHLPPIMHDVTQIGSDVRSIVRTVERDIPKLGKAFESIRDTADEIYKLEQMIRKRIQGPLLDASSIFSGFLRGFYTFWKKLFK